jgi:polyphosphate kinase
MPGPLNLKAFFEIAFLRGFPQLSDRELPPLPSVNVDERISIFDTIREKGSFLTHLPYESFNPVVKLLQEAADDPKVLAIKQTLYRVSGNSPVVKALIRAARNKKQVSVLFEIKARFDEENNINWAMELADAGAPVVYGVAGLKVHCKALIVVRKEDDGIRRYVHLSTGNYNDKTAKLYTDIGLFSDDKLLAMDVAALFNVITGFSRPPVWNKLFVAPFNLKERLVYLIDRESEISTPENPGHIVIKVNSLIDYDTIDHLYAAARRNVKIDLIVRGMCAVNPFQLKPEHAKNINVVSVLDRFLEHSRIYFFNNNGSHDYYIGSSDIMPRNLYKRIEILFPVDGEAMRAELDLILKASLEDKRKGRRLTGPNKYSRSVGMTRYEKTRSQIRLYEHFRRRFQEWRDARREEQVAGLTVFENPESNGSKR